MELYDFDLPLFANVALKGAEIGVIAHMATQADVGPEHFQADFTFVRPGT
jgi:hypothetical protein